MIPGKITKAVEALELAASELLAALNEEYAEIEAVGTSVMLTRKYEAPELLRTLSSKAAARKWANCVTMPAATMNKGPEDSPFDTDDEGGRADIF